LNLYDAAAQIRSHHAVAVLGAGLSAARYPMTANLAPLVWMALDADSAARAAVAKRVGSSESTGKGIVGWETSSLDVAWGEIANSPARYVFQRAFVDLDLEREPTPAHFALARMINARSVEYVVSFNWDTALERAYEQLYGVPIPPGALAKPHGDANHPEIPWVLPIDDGVVPLDVTAELSRLASSHPRVFMIVGYSGADPLVVRELLQPYEDSWPVVRVGPSFNGPEAIRGTAEVILPALVTELGLDAGLEHWRNVTFARQRSLNAALMGYRLGPADVESCPELPGLSGIVSRLRTARFVAVTGQSGSGKSISAFQAAHRLNMEAWRVLELINPGTATDSAVQEFTSHPGPVVAVVDDAQTINPSIIRAFERAASEDHAVILCTTTWETPAEQVAIVAKYAVETLASFCRTNKENLTDRVALLDDRVGYGPFFESIERRIELANEAEFPWQFMNTLSGGDRRIREVLDALRHDDYDALLALIALRQIVSADEGITLSELASHAQTLGFTEEWLDDGLDELRRNRVVFQRGGRIRLPHIRFAIRAVNDVLRQPSVRPAPMLIDASRDSLLSDSHTDRGRYWLLDSIHRESLRHSGRLVDQVVLGHLVQRLLNADAADVGVRALVVWAAQRWQPISQNDWARIVERMPGWILRATDETVYGLHWLLNGLRGADSESHQRVCVEVGLHRLISRMVEVATGEYVGSWESLISEVCQVDSATMNQWSVDLSQEVAVDNFAEWVSRETSTSPSPRGWADLAQRLWGVSSVLVAIIIRSITPQLIRGFETAPIDTNHAIFRWNIGFLSLMVADIADHVSPDADEDLALYRRLMSGWIDAVDWSRVGAALSDCRPGELHNFSMLVYWLSKIDQSIVDRLCHNIGCDMFDARPASYWQSQIWEDRDFVVVLSAATDMEPGRSLLLRHSADIEEVAPWAIHVVPEIAARLPADRVHVGHGSYSFRWEECAKGIEAVAAVDADAAIRIVEANRSVLVQELSRSQEHSGANLPRFIEALDFVEPTLFDRILADVNMQAAAPRWMKSLDDETDGAVAVDTILQRLGMTRQDLSAMIVLRE